MTYPYTLIGPIGTRATLGLIVLQTDETIEHDLRRMLPLEGVNLHASRIPNATEVTGDTLAEMKNHLPASAALMPNGLAFDCVGYGCTSGSAVIGPDAITDLVQQGCDARAVTNPLTAVIAAAKSLGITRLGLLSPYIESVNDTLRGRLDDAAIATPVFGSFNESIDSNVARIAPESIKSAAIDLANNNAIDAVFISCTNLRTLDVIPEIEAATGLPVLSSNQALAWHMATTCNLAITGNFGQLTTR